MIISVEFGNQRVLFMLTEDTSTILHNTAQNVLWSMHPCYLS